MADDSSYTQHDLRTGGYSFVLLCSIMSPATIYGVYINISNHTECRCKRKYNCMIGFSVIFQGINLLKKYFKIYPYKNTFQTDFKSV